MADIGVALNVMNNFRRLTDGADGYGSVGAGGAGGAGDGGAGGFSACSGGGYAWAIGDEVKVAKHSSKYGEHCTGKLAVRHFKG